MLSPSPYAPTMTTERRQRSEASGRWAETAAVALLMAKGYRVIERRLRARSGEIDIVAVRGRVVAFVEVKYRSSMAAAESSISARQARRIAQSAEQWIWRHPAFRDYVISLDTVLMAPWRWPRHVRHALERT